ncbi:MAG TPA: flotillin-like FloA family protein [Planctomycetaceae bacterium]|nr:flotillin-like FloA family protein [Planctomycetaceae bacterium]
MSSFWGITIAVIVLAGILIVISRYFALWIQAYVTGAHIGMLSLMLMSLRKVDPRTIVRCKIMAVQAGLEDIPTNAIESQYLAGGNVERVTQALIVAHRADLDLDWDLAAAIDLAGRNILEAVQISVTPQVIHCPDPGVGLGDTLGGVSKDGIQLKIRVMVTVRTNLAQILGGATEATVIARIGEAIVSSVGSCETYREVLADPLLITRRVLEKGLDSQTAYSIVSIDIADIDVGENIGARLQIVQANADMRVALALAEQRRAFAIAREQEMVAETSQQEATVVLAESLVPKAVAAGYRAGQLLAGDTQISPRYRSVTARKISIVPPRRRDGESKIKLT